jgi:hypothetical protein
VHAAQFTPDSGAVWPRDASRDPVVVVALCRLVYRKVGGERGGPGCDAEAQRVAGGPHARREAILAVAMGPGAPQVGHGCVELMDIKAGHTDLELGHFSWLTSCAAPHLASASTSTRGTLPRCEVADWDALSCPARASTPPRGSLL